MLNYQYGDEREAIAWVREHGWTEERDRKVEASMEVGDKYTLLRMELGKMLGYDLMGQLDASDEELVEKVGKRLMPEGLEWPRFETGEQVRPGDEFADGLGGMRICTSVELLGYEEGARDALVHWDGDDPDNALLVCMDSGERVKRPAPKVLDADGVEIHVGDTVYFTDGREQECNTVVHAKYDYKDEPYVQLGRLNDVGYPTYTNCSCIDPSHLTHTKPEQPDSWERLEADAKAWVNPTREERADLVRRAKKLAERGQ